MVICICQEDCVGWPQFASFVQYLGETYVLGGHRSAERPIGQIRVSAWA